MMGSGQLKYSKLETSNVTVTVYDDSAVVSGTSIRQCSAFPGSTGSSDASPFTAFFYDDVYQQRRRLEGCGEQPLRPPNEMLAPPQSVLPPNAYYCLAYVAPAQGHNQGTMKAAPDQDRHLYIRLEQGPVYHFQDWPNPAVPLVAAGVYTVWRGATLVYVGMAGRSLKATDIERQRSEGGKRTGLFSRLSSHVSGRRSGDQFCVYVCDRLVMPTLTLDQIASIAAGELSLDKLVRLYIHQHLSYRFTETPDSKTAFRIEDSIRRGVLAAGKPLLNAATSAL